MTETRKPLLIVEDDPALQKQMQWAFDQYETIVANDRASRRSRRCAASSRRSSRWTSGCRRSRTIRPRGCKLLEEIHALVPDTKVIVLTGQNDRANALKAIALGAHDFCTKPFEPELLTWTIDRAFRVHELQEENRAPAGVRTSRAAMSGIITRDPGDAAHLPHDREGRADVGHGADPRRIGHRQGTARARAARPVAAPRRAASSRSIARRFPRTLLESELFGYEKGAFTGAAKQTLGKIETANGGTLFLDEIGDLPMSLQAKLLRFLQERVIERIGGRQEIPVDVRIVCATHQSLKDADRRRAGSARTCTTGWPRSSSRSRRCATRKGDAALLAHGFVRKFAAEQRRGAMTLLPDAVDAIEAHAWPGNVRELENVHQARGDHGRRHRRSAPTTSVSAPGDAESAGAQSAPGARTRRRRTPCCACWAASTAISARRPNCSASAARRCTI